MAVLKVGILSCSGEECLGGTISRLATRKVLEEMTMVDTVTLCLPLYNAGGTEELDWYADGFVFRLLRTAGEPEKIYKVELVKVVESMQ